MKKVIFLIVLYFLHFQNNPGLGQSAVGYEFLRTFVGARPSAMGGAFIGVTGDIHNVVYNPAGLAYIAEKRGTVSYLDHLLDFNSGFLAYAHPMKKGVAAVALNFIDFGQFERRGENNEDQGEFGANGLAFSLSYARFLFTNFSLAGSAKYIRFSIDDRAASAIAIDAGLSYTIPDKALSFGIAVLNLGATTSAFIDTKDDLPINIQIGASKVLEHLPAMVSLALVKFKDESIDFRVGTEIRATRQLRVRLGYNSVGQDQKVDTSMDKFAGISFGLGFVMKKFDIDYSYSSFGEVGTLNRFTLVGRF